MARILSIYVQQLLNIFLLTFLYFPSPLSQKNLEDIHYLELILLSFSYLPYRFLLSAESSLTFLLVYPTSANGGSCGER